MDETATVEMHNELRETPKTGDDFNPALFCDVCIRKILDEQNRKKQGKDDADE